MSLAALACAFAKADRNPRVEWARLFAFMGRYGHQSIPEMMEMPASLIQDVAREIGKILEQEAEAIRVE